MSWNTVYAEQHKVIKILQHTVRKIKWLKNENLNKFLIKPFLQHFVSRNYDFVEEMRAPLQDWQLWPGDLSLLDQ